jgi:hypothetical protein
MKLFLIIIICMTTTIYAQPAKKNDTDKIQKEKQPLAITFERQNFLIQQIKTSIQNANGNPEKVFDSFFNLYEQKFFSKNSLYDGLAEFESPFKEIIAAHQAWGMIGSDGFDNYLSQVDESFDEQVRLGLSLLGKADCYRGLIEARKLFKQNKGTIPENEDDRLWKLFYTPITDFETIIGKYLVELYK